MKSYDTFSALEDNIRQRLNSADPTESYVAQLAHKGLDSILKKVGEEATEVVIAAKGQDRDQTIYEVADLWFHTMVLLGQQSIALDDVANELARRMGQSGLAEKAQRSS